MSVEQELPDIPRALRSLPPALKIAALLLVVALGAGAWQLYRLVNPKVSAEAATAGCDLQGGPCRFELADGSQVTLELSPRPLMPMTNLQVQARIEGLEPDKVELDVTGVDMYMGYNRPGLSPSSDGVYSGKLILPICSSRIMSWQADLLITMNGDLVKAPFRFTTDASR